MNKLIKLSWVFLLVFFISACEKEIKDQNSTQNDTAPLEIAQDSIYLNGTQPAGDVTILFDWNDLGDGDSMWKGWLWQKDVAYSNEGWVLDTGGRLGDGITTYFGQSPRSFDKSDYKDDNFAEISTLNRAPSTSNGASFRVFDNPQNDVSPNQATWWMYYGAQPLSKRSVTTGTTDRMSFYIKLDGLRVNGPEGTPEAVKTNFHVGTYLCWETNLPVYSTGDGCPREGPGNQHYYHYLALNPGAWLHVELDDHPNHQRGSRGNSYHKNNPVENKGKNYFEQLSRFYFEIRSSQANDTEFLVDEISFYSTSEAFENNQNDESITSLWVGYWPEKGYWEIGFKDGANFTPSENKFSTFEIRWSTSPINNQNYAKANLVYPEFFSGEKYVGNKNPHYVRRVNDYTRDVWTRFELPKDITDNYQMVFFAIKDVTQQGENEGTSWPWTRQDHGVTPSKFIRTINYALRPLN